MIRADAIPAIWRKWHTVRKKQYIQCKWLADRVVDESAISLIFAVWPGIVCSRLTRLNT
jgi:hypothetical protein